MMVIATVTETNVTPMETTVMEITTPTTTVMALPALVLSKVKALGSKEETASQSIATQSVRMIASLMMIFATIA